MSRHFRSRELLDLCYQFNCCIQLDVCEGGPGEPCHSNQSRHGKGAAIKAKDMWVVPGCRSCHRQLDQGSLMTREERVEAWDRAFIRFYEGLWERGLIRIA